jgi:signal transduction histidine kinase
MPYGWLDDPIEGPWRGAVNTVFAARAAEAWSVTTHDGLKSCSAAAVSARFRTAYNVGAVVSAPFSREGCRGRVFALDCALANSQLSLVEIVADRVGLGLEYCFLLRQVEATAAEREKSKLAHDLHDGLLQNLTAATLLLKVCSGNCEGEIRHNLDSIRKLLAGEQRRLRHFVNGWRHKNGSEDYSLAGACKSALTELSAYWNCHTSLRVSPRDARLPAAVAEHLWLIFTEAIANAVKHGKASRVRVYVVRTTQALAICISDNGRGFHGLAGSYTDDTLVAEHIGPQSLCERVRGLRGHLSLSTSPAGSRLQIRLPI